MSDSERYVEITDYVDCDHCDWDGETAVGSLTEDGPQTAQCPECGTVQDA